MVKKHFNKLVLGILFVLAVGVGIIGDVFFSEDVEAAAQNETGSKMEAPKDYNVTKSIDILVNEENYIHEDKTVIIGTIEDIVYADDKLSAFVVKAIDEKQYTIPYQNLELISTDITKTEDVDGINEVHLTFRTGGEVTLKEGEEAKLYRNSTNGWSFDEREHPKQNQGDFVGTIVDFAFLPTVDQKGDVYISHMIVEDEAGERAEVYFHNLGTKSIKSDGDITVYYAGSIFTASVFEIEESQDFALKIWTGEQTYTLAKGDEINLKQIESKGYWEIAEEIDITRAAAEIVGFEFGFTGTDIISFDYINLELENGESVNITMLQTKALYALPYGDYEKIYVYEGHDKVLVDIEPMDEFMIELYYEDDIILELSIGEELWVYQNEDGIWIVDYEYQAQSEEEE